MIERFNFYDVYGYLIPGGVAFSLVWLPFALAVTPKLPETVTAAAVAAVLAYVAGHLLQMLARPILTWKRAAHGFKNPSSYKIDDPKFAMSDEVAKAIKGRFGIDILAEVERRDEAAMQCRSHLVAQGRAAYAEQQEGMYALMRGISAAAAAAACFTFGWFFGAFTVSPLTRHAVLAIGVLALLIMIVWKGSEDVTVKQKSRFAILILTFVATLGFASASGHAGYRWLMLALAFGEVFIALRTFGAFIYFAELFAEAVYRDFLNLEREQKPTQPGWRA